MITNYRNTPDGCLCSTAYLLSYSLGWVVRCAISQCGDRAVSIALAVIYLLFPLLVNLIVVIPLIYRMIHVYRIQIDNKSATLVLTAIGFFLGMITYFAPFF